MKKFYILIIALLAINSAKAQGCLPEGITFTTQEQIDNFQADYPGCTEIEGDVLIQEIDPWAIWSLNGLDVITSIVGTVTICYTDGLYNLYGLDNLDSIGGDLQIGFCNSLNNLNGLQNLSFIGGGLLLWYNEHLLNIQDLENTSYIGDDLVIGYQDLLTSLIGLNKIDSIGRLEIYKNSSLTDLVGLENLLFIETDFKLDYNESIINLAGIDSLNYIGGNLTIKDNFKIASLHGLEKLTYIGGNFDFGTFHGGQPYFKNLTGLESLTKIGGFLTIAHNDSLEIISGFNNLTTIGRHFTVYYNKSLLSIDSLWNLKNIGSTLGIGYNNLLQNIGSLANIEADSLSALYIHNNSLLSECDVKSICDYISKPDAYLVIHDNATGCNSREEIEEACLVGIQNIILENELSIFPNPSSSRFTIQFNLENEKQVKLLVLNNLGQVLATLTNETLSEGQHELNWYAEGMPAGVYFYNIQIGNQAGTGKMVLMK